jgi:hypothetical protein
MPNNYSDRDLEKYDLILFCNGGEPLQISTNTIQKLITHKKVYLIANSYLDSSHPMIDKVVWFPEDVKKCRDYWTRHFYPQYFENIKNKSIVRQASMIAINGSVRVNRYHFFNLLKTQIPIVPQLSQISKSIHRLNDSVLWESSEDTQFKNWLNTHYQDRSIPQPDHYYDNSPTVGINDKFGKIPPGYFIMPEYFKYACVIFPESTWQNDELAMTEKAFKCFYTGSLPFPIGGANINQLYNDVGFYTAWNLLPDNLKQFDRVKDHLQRYQQAVDAIVWLNSTQSVFENDQFATMVNHNRSNFLTCSCDYISINRFYDILKTKLKLDLDNEIL